MTDPADFEPSDQLLPGLEQPRLSQGANERAAHRTIRALHSAGLVDEQHALLLQVALTGARQLDRAATSDKAKDYGVANLMAQLRETYLVLVPESEEGGERDAYQQFLHDLANSSGSSPAVRDAT